jgi:prolyl-tRNA editing enzyme YbaK/EbsC (Cys-tRNA(Pro) deacylase)
LLEDFIESNRLHAKVLDCHEEVHTAKQAAVLMKVPMEQILKSLLFLDENENAFLALVPGNKQASFPKLKQLFGTKKMRLATPLEVREITGYEIGGLPPISVYGAKTVLDSSFEKQKFVLAGGGDDHHLLHVEIKELKENVPELLIADIVE